MATLVITEGPAEGLRFALAQHRLVMVGRDASCSIQVVDPQLSRRHLQVKYLEDEDRHVAIDYGSKNGILLNGSKMEGEVRLKDCDVMVLGGTTIVYSTNDELDARHVREALKRFGQGHVKTLTESSGPSI